MRSIILCLSFTSLIIMHTLLPELYEFTAETREYNRHPIIILPLGEEVEMEETDQTIDTEQVVRETEKAIRKKRENLNQPWSPQVLGLTYIVGSILDDCAIFQCPDCYNVFEDNEVDFSQTIVENGTCRLLASGYPDDHDTNDSDNLESTYRCQNCEEEQDVYRLPIYLPQESLDKIVEFVAELIELYGTANTAPSRTSESPGIAGAPLQIDQPREESSDEFPSHRVPNVGDEDDDEPQF